MHRGAADQRRGLPRGDPGRHRHRDDRRRRPRLPALPPLQHAAPTGRPGDACLQRVGGGGLHPPARQRAKRRGLRRLGRRAGLPLAAA